MIRARFVNRDIFTNEQNFYDFWIPIAKVKT